ncbi:MAG: hypothetical protein ACKVOH_04910 [Chlamydiales bacterium]
MLKIPRRNKRCCQNAEPFLPGSTYISKILNGEERKDYCPACWEKVEEKGQFWVGKISEKRDLSPDKKALALFSTLVETRDKPPLLFLLALYLERNKELIRRPQLSGREERCYEVMESGELVFVPVLLVSPQEEAETLQELSHLFE